MTRVNRKATRWLLCLLVVLAVVQLGARRRGGPQIKIVKPTPNSLLNSTSILFSVSYGAGAVPSTFSANLDLVRDVTADFTVKPWGAFGIVTGVTPGEHTIVTSVQNAMGKSRTVSSSFEAANPLVLSFQEPPQTISVVHPVDIAARDLNGDSLRDLVVARDQGIDIFLQESPRVFPSQPNASVATQQIMANVEFGDFNGDGRVEIIAAGELCPEIWIIELDEFGGVTSFNSFPIVPLECALDAEGFGLELEDFDRDGNLDFLVTSGSFNKLALFLGDGQGNFAQQPFIDVEGSFPVGLGSGDFDRDGNSDFALGYWFSKDVEIWHGNGLGGFAKVNTFPELGNLVFSIEPGDFNGDLLPDLAGSIQGANFWIALGDESGLFTNGAQSVLVPILGSVRNLAVNDVNNDSFDDVLVSVEVTSGAAVMLGDGLGGFSLGATFTPTARSYFVWDKDIDGDGLRDVISADFDFGGSSNVSIFWNTSQPAP